MTYKPLIVVDDDNEAVLKLFKLKSHKANVIVQGFRTWDKTKQFLEENDVDAIVLDARGQLNADANPGEAHLFESYPWVLNSNIPYAIYTAYTDELPMLRKQAEEGRV